MIFPTRAIYLGAACLAILTAPAAHAACTKPSFTKAEMQTINPRKLNQALYSSAATKVTNFYRCKAGKKPLKEDHGLVTAAATLSKKMASKTKMAHDSSSQRKARYRKGRVKTKIFAENIGHDARLNFGTTPFIAQNAGICAYVFQGSKQPIPQHSYASLATRSVANWWNSSGHKKNMVHPKVKSVGNGIGYSSKSNQPCGGYYMTQNFAD